MEEQSLSAPAFEWTPLNNARKEIRVLELAQGDRHEPLCGQLRHVFLDLYEKPYYEAISYVWGNTARTASIVVYNAPIAIPETASSALRCMRPPNESRRLWIDCICIDQNDELEKGHQISIMLEIFTLSQGTLAHLGGDDGFAQSAVEVFEGLGQWQLEIEACGLSASHKGAGLARSDMNSIHKFLNLPYFR